jgi:hypothetical protein
MVINMFYPFPIVTNSTPEQIKSGREFKVLGHTVSIRSIPDDWMYSFIDDRIMIGRKDGKYTTYLEIKAMLIVAAATQKQIHFKTFMSDLNLGI